MNWFDEYARLTKDERDYYKEYICDDDQKPVALDYDRLIESLKFIATDPQILCRQTSNNLNLAEEVALSFNDEAYHISQYLHEQKYIDEGLIQEIDKIKGLFNRIHQDSNNDWSLDYMTRDEKWICIRTIADGILSKFEICE